MESRTHAQQRQHAIVHGGEVAEQVEDPVLPRRNLLLQIAVAEGGKHLISLARLTFRSARGQQLRSAVDADGCVMTISHGVISDLASELCGNIHVLHQGLPFVARGGR